MKADNLPGRSFKSGSDEYLYFSGTSYLGMATNPQFQALIREGMAIYGSNYSSSRNSNIQIDIFEKAEAYLAKFTHHESALTVSSGFMAGQVVIRSLEKTGNFYYAPNAHPAVTRSEDDFYTGKYDDWVDQVIKNHRSIKGEIVLIINSIDPLYVRKNNFDWLHELSKDRKILVIVDDSHGFGIIGEDGNGITSAIPGFDHIEILVLSSFGKAFGVPGGVILGKSEIINKFRSHPYFGGSSPLVPAYLYAFIKGFHLYAEAREKLWKNIERFSSGTANTGFFNTFTCYPVFYTAENALYEYLLASQVLISSFRYPTQYDDLVTRVVINSNHTSDDIEKLCVLIKAYQNEKESN